VILVDATELKPLSSGVTDEAAGRPKGWPVDW